MFGVSAQVSLYPLRQDRLSPVIDEAIKIFKNRGIEVELGPMSTLLTGDDQMIFEALTEAFRKGAEMGEIVMVVTLSNACPVPASG
jgi:uncharacterized protein YqgV (UPF0045/DUF77 family)